MFTAEELLRKNFFQFPKERDDDDFLEYIKKLFTEFRKLIVQVEGDDLLSTEIIAHRDLSVSLCDGIESAIAAYFQGYPHKAYDQLDAALKRVEPVLARLLRLFKKGEMPEHLYRIRTGTGAEYPKGELFHIPFQMRHKVKTQRFSIPGLPCLYLGGSLYGCWEELGRPDFNTMHMSRFCAADGSSLRLLNLGYRPDLFALIIDRDREALNDKNFISVLSSNMIIWPISISSHIKVKYRSGDFKPEYIIPQILLQWIRNGDQFDGITYISKHVKGTLGVPEAQMNFAFPAREMQPCGYCPRLLKEFEFTQPLSWQLASTFDPGAMAAPASTSTALPSWYNFKFEPIPGLNIDYRRTTWWGMESRLCALGCACL
jgi:RES domain